MLNRPLAVATALPWLAFAFLLAAYHALFSLFYPLPNGLMGHDYAYNIPAYLDGYYWFRNNGFLQPPWFTPSFCGGQVYFGDPQSSFYSLPQFLLFAGLPPVSAVYTSVLIFAGIGYWGMYLLARRFDMSVFAAVGAAGLFMFNGFFAYRMAVGHITFQSFMLLPLLAWLLCYPTRNRADTLLHAVLASLGLAYCLQSGLTSLMVPSSIALLALGLTGSLRGMRLGPFLLKLALSGSLALALCASKLVASLTLLSYFPRKDYLLPGFDNLAAILKVLFVSLFGASQDAFDLATPLWRNVQWGQLPHEMAYGLTPIPLLIFALAFLQKFPGMRLMPTPPRTWLIVRILALLLLLLLPVSLLYFSPSWNAFLKTLPLINATSAPERWWMLYIPLIALASGLAADASPILARASCFLIVLGIPLLTGLEDRNYYFYQNFDPAPIEAAYTTVAGTGRVPEIHTNGDAVTDRDKPVAPNIRMVRGISSLDCYNPLYGYRLEHFRRAPLQPGTMLTLTESGTFNVRNPACLLYPVENQCRTWDAFGADQQTSAKAFVSYHPIQFKRSAVQRFADAVTTGTLIAFPLLIVFLLARRRKNAQASPEA